LTRSQPTDRKLDFVPLASANLSGWSRPERFGFCDALAFVPLSDSELLHMSHYCPIAIAVDSYGPTVVALLHSELVKARPLDAEYRWTAPYMPMALRCLPFRDARGGGDPEVAPELVGEANENKPIYLADGEPAAEFQQVKTMLERMERGRRRLSDAAKLLIAADILSPLAPPQNMADGILLVADPSKLAALTPRKAAALTADSNLAFEIAGASIFSMRWLDTRRIETSLDRAPEQIGAPANRFETVEIDDAIEQPVLMDASELFSIDAFLAAGDPENDDT
jgi:hypothetical protein